MTFLDRTFWLTESQANPKHVAGLQIFELPKNAPSDYVEQLFLELKTYDKAVSPFNCRVKHFSVIPFKLSPVDNLDMNYHVQLHQLEDINDNAALHQFVASLHETWLDRDKPLWQHHFIVDKSRQRFAVYMKIHHLYGDGATLIRWFQSAYSQQKSTNSFVPVWAATQKQKVHCKPRFFKQLISGVWDAIITLKDVVWILFRLLLKQCRINQDYMPVPFTGTKTILTGQVKKGRVVTSVSVDFTRVQVLGKQLRASANEIMLCALDIAVHRFLRDYGQSFEKALCTNMPINLRKPGENTTGNKIAIVPVQLAHGDKDPYIRLRQIIENHRVVMRAARVSHPAAFSYYTVIIQSFATLFEMLGISNWVRPIANVLISNMPGPAHTLYYKDAKLLAAYPISTMTPGGGLNITMLTYNGAANIGMVCCKSKITSLEPMAQYFQDALDILEKCVDQPSLTVDDFGEKTPEAPKTIVEDDIYDIRSDG